MKLKDAKVIGYMQPTSGVHYHRIMLPVSGLGLDGSLVTNDIDLIRERIQAGQCDILIYNRFIPTLDADELVKLRYKHGFKIVVDNDDYWILDAHHILYHQYRAGLAHEIVKNIQIADLVTVTHHRLARKAQFYNERTFVVPNALPYDQYQFNAERVPHQDFVRIGWAGGVTHEKDLEILRRPMQRLHSWKYLADQVEMRIFGYSEDNAPTREIWGRMASALTVSGKLRYQAYPPLPVDQYMAAYAELDLVLVPLKDTTFNGFKSNLKLLEAGAKNLPVICSQVLPYYEGHDIPGVAWVASQKDWIYWIRKYLKDPGAREMDGHVLGTWVRKNFSLARWSLVRAELFETILNQ